MSAPAPCSPDWWLEVARLTRGLLPACRVDTGVVGPYILKLVVNERHHFWVARGEYPTVRYHKSLGLSVVSSKTLDAGGLSPDGVAVMVAMHMIRALAEGG